MIHKMTKYQIVAFTPQLQDFLDRLSELGVVDVTRGTKAYDDKSRSLLDTAKRYAAVIARLAKVESSDADAKTPSADAQEAPELTFVETLFAEIKSLEEEKAVLAKHAAAARVWGSFSADDIQRLECIGLHPQFYSVKSKKFNPAWEEEYPLEILAQEYDNIYFTVLRAKDDADFAFPLAECPFPEKAAAEYSAEIAEIQAGIDSRTEKLRECKRAVNALAEARENTLRELDLYFAKESGAREAEDFLTVLQAFAPSENDAVVKEFLDGSDVVYISEEAKVEDNPPIKLRNNRFFKMFEVLTGMYGMPVYNEFDPTPVLGPFFLLFFSMCMGDAGYGIILMILGLLAKKLLPSMADLAPLVTALGVSTTVIGFILGTFFGINLYEAAWYPEALKGLIVHGKVMGYDAQMVLAVGIGVFHICLAMIIKSICFTCANGFRATLGTWGWTLLIIGGLIIAGLSLLGVMDSAVTKIAVIVLGVVSAMGIYFFNTPGRNPLLNLGSGLWDTYSMVTGLLGDVLSYIRLYALGLAGGMLGGVFNLLGSQILDMPIPGLNIILMVFILVFGHTLNIAMSCLGAFVHPLRLTFVEYFKNVGYQGQGAVYNPLKKNK